MKIATIIIRVLFGALFIFSSVVVLFNLMPQPPMAPGPAKTLMEGMAASGYLLTFIKITELVCGILLVIGVFAPLATIVIFPISINIFLFHAFIAQEGLVMGTIVLLVNLFLAYSYRKNYTGLLMAKAL